MSPRKGRELCVKLLGVCDSWASLLLPGWKFTGLAGATEEHRWRYTRFEIAFLLAAVREELGFATLGRGIMEEGGVLSESSSKVEGLELFALRFLEREWATDDRLEGPGVAFRRFG